MKTILFDTETSSFPEDNPNNDILIQLCYSILEENSIYSTYLKPKNLNINPRAMSIHHITPEFLEDKESKEESKIFQDFKNLLESDEEKILIAHNIKFDYEIIQLAGIEPNNCKLICTLKVTEFLNDKQKLIYENNKLQYMKYYYRLDKKVQETSKRFNINIEDLSAHDARHDVIDLICYYEFILEEFKASIESLLEVSNNPLLLTYVPFGKNRGEKFTDLNSNQLRYYETLDGDIAYTAYKILN